MLFNNFDMILFLIGGLAIMLVTLAIIFDNILQKLKLLYKVQKDLEGLFCYHYGIIKTDDGYKTDTEKKV